MSELFEITCPLLQRDIEGRSRYQAVIAHTAAVKPKTFCRFRIGGQGMREQEGRKKRFSARPWTRKKNKLNS